MTSTPDAGRGELLRSGLTVVADAIVIGLLCVAGCVLVITAPAALSATISVIETRRQAPADSLTASFAGAFRSALSRGVVLGLLGVVLWLVVAVDVLYVLAQPQSTRRAVVLAMALLLSTVILAVSVWVPELLRRPELTLSGLLRAALILGFGRPVATLLSLVALGIGVAVAIAVVPIAPLSMYAAVRVLTSQTSGRSVAVGT